jgi:hypothetical protein
MSIENFVQCTLVTPVTASSTELVLVAPTAPYKYPPTDGGVLTLVDSVGRPSFVEFIRYTSRIGNVLYGVTRGIEGTTARAWSGATFAYQSLTAGEYVADLAAKLPASAIGVTVQAYDADTAKTDVARTWTAVQTFGKATYGTRVAIPASSIDVSAGDIYTKTITGATTFTVANTPASGTTASFLLDLTNGGAGVVTWWAGVKWAGATAPKLTAAGRDVLGFFTHDGGTTWSGLVLGVDVK